MKERLTVRPSPIAGSWYPEDAVRLADMVDTFIQQAEIPALEGEVKALIAPHAGYRYSGRTAGYAFRTIKGYAADLVVVVSPFHDYHPSPFLTTVHSAYWTPLGEIPVEQELIALLDGALRKECGVGITALANDREHSLEIELPFLQRSLAGDFRLLPIMVRPITQQLARSLGFCMASILEGQRALLVASTDLSHFYRETDADLLDSEMLKQIGAFSPEGVLKAEETGAGFACGAYAVAAVLWAARKVGADTVTVLHHSTSAEQTGDRSAVVGYGAAAILRRA